MNREPEEKQEHESGGLQHAAEHERPHKRLSVMNYLTILFAAAFLLLLLSYLMQQRTNSETIEGLKQSVSAMQSIDSLQKEKEGLESQVALLEEQVAHLEGQVSALQNETAALQSTAEDQAHAAEAMDWFWRIQRELSRGRYGSARSLVEAFQATGLWGRAPPDHPGCFTGLEDCLPTDHPADPEGPSPAEQYQEILAVLY